MTIRLAAAAALLLTTSACVSDGYIDPMLPPSYGTVTLNAGFRDDPHQVEIVAGGDMDASAIGGECVGYIASAPDYRLIYRAGEHPLTIEAEGEEDLTLVVSGPDGGWHCDDDSAGYTDPRIRFRNPQSGQYDIWIGVFDGGTAASILSVTER